MNVSKTLAALALCGAMAAAAQAPLGPITVEQWRERAAQGDAAAQYALARLLDGGVGVAEDDVEARKWYRLAADQGHADAQRALARLYDDGAGVAEDDAEALRWYRRAAAQAEAGGRAGPGFRPAVDEWSAGAGGNAWLISYLTIQFDRVHNRIDKVAEEQAVQGRRLERMEERMQATVAELDRVAEEQAAQGRRLEAQGRRLERVETTITEGRWHADVAIARWGLLALIVAAVASVVGALSGLGWLGGSGRARAPRRRAAPAVDGGGRDQGKVAPDA